MRRSIAAALAAAAIVVGCGEESSEPAERDADEVREAIEAAATPDGPWDVPGTRWSRLTESERVGLAKQFIAENPDRCSGADPDQVAGYVTAVYGVDYPEHMLAGEILPEACDASLQS